MKLLEIIKSFFIATKRAYSNGYAMNLSYENLDKAIKSLRKTNGGNILTSNKIEWAKAHQKFLSKAFPKWFMEEKK
jgi:hypothetical protein